MTTEEIAQKVLDLLFHEKLPDTQAFEGIFGGNLGFEVSEEQQAAIKRFLLNTTRLCETVSNTGLMHVVKLSPFGWEVMTKHGSYSAYLAHQEDKRQADADAKKAEIRQQQIERELPSRHHRQNMVFGLLLVVLGWALGQYEPFHCNTRPEMPEPQEESRNLMLSDMGLNQVLTDSFSVSSDSSSLRLD